MPASAELFSLRTPGEAWALLALHLTPITRVETVELSEALGRTLALDVIAPEDLPAFRRSTVDGYAVRAVDTYGATPGLPALLRVTGEAAMGAQVSLDLADGAAILVHTGSMLPPAADAVVMVEHTQRTAGAEIEVMRPVAPGENALAVGEDATVGGVIARQGHRLRPADLGALAALGITRVTLRARPRVALLATGDEVVPPTQRPGPGQVRDVNSTALAALVTQAGGEPVPFGILPDQREPLLAAARQAHATCDVVVVAAGSSVSTRDLSVEVIDALGRPGVLVHGLSVKPGKPTILAAADGVPVIGLPGNPASALQIAERFLVPAIIARLGGTRPPTATVQARLTRNLASTTGREDYVPVRLETRPDGLWATPIFGKSNLIVTLLRAEGTLTVPLDENGLQAGTWVTVSL